MDDWKEVKLGELIHVKYGKDHKKLQGGIYPCFGSGGIMRYVNDFLYDKESILIPRKGSLNNIIYQDKPFWTVDTMFWSEISEEDTIPKFLFYQLSLIDYTVLNVGSAVPSLTVPVIKEIDVILPPLPEQKAIAEVLSSLDDKIDLLHRQNETLEEMAQTLFRQWFVEEADESWEFIKLSEIAEVKNGFAFSSKSYVAYTSECLEVFKMGHIERGGGLRQNPKMDFVPREERLKRYILNKNDIVMAMTDMKDNVVILGVPAMIDKDNHYVLNQRVARIYLKTKEKLISQYLLYTQLNDKENIALLQSKANSGVQVNLSTQSIKDIEILIPPMRLQKEKGQTIIELYEKKDKNMFHIKTLEKLRDNLLPKLMSGEVRVNL